MTMKETHARQLYVQERDKLYQSNESCRQLTARIKIVRKKPPDLYINKGLYNIWTLHAAHQTASQTSIH